MGKKLDDINSHMRGKWFIPKMSAHEQRIFRWGTIGQKLLLFNMRLKNGSLFKDSP